MELGRESAGASGTFLWSRSRERERVPLITFARSKEGCVPNHPPSRRCDGLSRDVEVKR